MPTGDNAYQPTMSVLSARGVCVITTQQVRAPAGVPPLRLDGFDFPMPNHFVHLCESYFVHVPLCCMPRDSRSLVSQCRVPTAKCRPLPL